MADAQSATSLTSSRDFASNAFEPIKPNTNTAKLGDLSKFGSSGEGGLSTVDTACDCLGIPGCRQLSQATFSDAFSVEEQGVKLQKAEIMAIVQGVVKNSMHAASLMDPTDPDHRLLAVSESLQEITGYTESELQQASPRLLTVGCEHFLDPEVQAAMRSSHSTGSPLLAQAVNRTKQGSLYWSTMYIRGLIVAVDPASDEPMWLVLTAYSSSEGPSDEAEEHSCDVLRKLRGAGEDLRAEIRDELARRAGGACRPAPSEADTSLGCGDDAADDCFGPVGGQCIHLPGGPRWC